MENLDSIFGPEMFGTAIFFILGLAASVLTIMIAILAMKKVPGTAGKLIASGAILMVSSSLFGYFLQFFIMRTMAMRDIGSFFTLNAVFSTIANLLFLIGIFMLLQNHLSNHKHSDTFHEG